MAEAIVPVLIARLDTKSQGVGGKIKVEITYKNGATRITTQSPVIEVSTSSDDMFAHDLTVEVLIEAQDTAGNVVGEPRGGPDIDSIKQFITLKKDVTKLATARLSPKQDPDQLFSQRDILVLYLAHLTCLAESAISSLGYSPNMKRRFTHPAWEPQIRATNETEMRLMMAEAIVLARSAPESFTDKIALIDARALLDQLKELEPSSLPLNLIAEPIREATAAGAGALLKTKEGKRDVYLVVDIGAGTTDVAGFYCLKHPDRELARVFEVSGAGGAKTLQGMFWIKHYNDLSSTEPHWRKTLKSIVLRPWIRLCRRLANTLVAQCGGTIVEFCSGGCL